MKFEILYVLLFLSFSINCQEAYISMLEAFNRENHQILVDYKTVGWFASKMLKVKSSNGEPVTIDSPGCKVYKDGSFACENHNYHHISASCSSCIDQTLTVLFHLNDDIFYWNVVVNERTEKALQLKIWIDRMTEVTDMEEVSERSNMSYPLTQLFQAWGEEPLLRKHGRVNYLKLNCKYDFEERCWLIDVDFEKLGKLLPIIEVCAKEYLYQFKGHVAGVLYNLPQLPLVQHKAEALNKTYTVSDDIVGKTSTHACFPHRILVATADHLVLTTDQFKTHLVLEFPTDSQVVDFLLTSDCIYVLFSDSKLFSSSVLKSAESFRFELVEPGGVVENITGISSVKLCLLPYLPRPVSIAPNQCVLVWSSKTILLKFHSGANFHRLSLPFNTSFTDIIFVAPDLLQNRELNIIYLDNSTTLTLVRCQILSIDKPLVCQKKGIPNFKPDDLSFKITVSNLANLPVVLYNKNEVGYSSVDQTSLFKFSEPIKKDGIKNVVQTDSFDHLVVISNTNQVYFGTARQKKLILLPRKDSPDNSNVTYLFDQPLSQSLCRVEWHRSGENYTFNVEKLATKLEVYSALANTTEKAKDACDHIYKKFLVNGGKPMPNSVMDFTGFLQSVSIEYVVRHVFTSDSSLNIDPLKCSLAGNIMISMNTSHKQDTFYQRELVMREDTLSLTIQPIMVEEGQAMGSRCNKELTMVDCYWQEGEEIEACDSGTHQVFYINVTCVPENIVFKDLVSGQECEALLINNEVDDVSSFLSENFSCIIEVDTHGLVDPLLFKIVNGEKQLIFHDLKITELNNKNTWNIYSIPGIKQDCQLCPNFTESGTNHQNYLQIANSACPCKFNQTDKYISQLNFQHSYVSADTDYYLKFDLLDDSCCNVSYIVKFKAPYRNFLFCVTYTTSVAILTVLAITLLLGVVSYFLCLQQFKEELAKRKFKSIE